MPTTRKRKKTGFEAKGLKIRSGNVKGKKMSVKSTIHPKGMKKGGRPMPLGKVVGKSIADKQPAFPPKRKKQIA